MAEQNGSQNMGQEKSYIDEGPTLRLDWQIPEAIVTRYATNITVQRGEHEYIISFFEAQPPILIGDPDEVHARIAELKTVPAICVARVIVSAARMPGFVQALQGNQDSVEDSNDAESSSKE